MKTHKPPKRLSKAAADKQCREWNMKYPIGSPFQYQEIIGEPTECDLAMTRTRSEAWCLGHGAIVVLVHGKTGGVLIEHLFPIEESE